MPADNNNTTRQTSAPGQALGYSLQYDRVFYRLLTSPTGSIVSMECFEDVGVQQPDGTTIAEQDKSSIDGNPLSNRSVDLWKSLANWAEKVSSGELDPGKTTFIIWVAKPCEGPIVKQLKAADTPADAGTTIESILNELRDGQSDFSSVGDTVHAHIERFVECLEKDRSAVLSMLSKFTYECGSGNMLADIRQYFSQHQVVRESIELDMIYHGHGWIHHKINEAIAARTDARIGKDALIGELKACEQRFGAHDVLEVFGYSLSDKESKHEMANRTYVQQLRYIQLSQDELLQAVQDKLCASATRTHWIEAQRVHEKSLRDFADKLQRRWQNVKGRTELSHGDLTRVHQGRVIYSDCTTNEMRIENMDVPAGFVPGSYHELADDEIVWWHPDYHTLKRSASSEEVDT